MNPLDWTARPFLTLYLCLVLAAVLTVARLRLVMTRQGPNRWVGTLTTPELAWLRGGRERAADTVLVTFFTLGIATMRPAGGGFEIGPSRKGLPGEMRAFHDAPLGSMDRRRFRAAIGRGLDAVEAGMVRHGLIPRPEDARHARRVTWLLLLIPLALGAAKIVVGAGRGRPVGFLVALEVATLLLGWFLATHMPARTAAGQAAARASLKRHARAARAPQAHEQALAFALLGGAALAGLPFAQFVAPARASDGGGGGGCGGSGGDSGGGDSGGGGGCGGCGGGGGGGGE